MKKSYLYTLVFLFPFLVAGQQDGQVDYGFNSSGSLFLSIDNEHTYVNSFVEQNDHKLLISGNAFPIGDFILRLNDDGSFDNTFGQNGINIFHFDKGVLFQMLYKIVLSDDKILGVANLSEDEIVLVRFNSNGSLDESFGVSGYYTLPWIQGEIVSMFSQDENKIVIAANLGLITRLVRFDETMTLDQSFGNQGVFDLSQSDFPNNNLKVVLPTSENIVLAGIYNTTGGQRALIARLTYDGQVDTSFGVNQNGFSNDLILPATGAVRIGQLTDDTYVLGYSYRVNQPTVIEKTFLSKFSSNGQLMTSFGNNGLLEIGDYFIRTLLTQPNNRILVSGNKDLGGDLFSMKKLKRFYSNGNIDPTFGNEGVITFYPDGYHQFIALQMDGKILSFNQEIAMYSSRHKILRYHNNPLSVVDFEPNELLIFPNPSTGDFNLELSTRFLETDYEVFDNLGKKILNGIFSNVTHTIDLSNQPVGMYYLTTPFKTFKLIKK